jgi:hypothetical protein
MCKHSRKPSTDTDLSILAAHRELLQDKEEMDAQWPEVDAAIATELLRIKEEQNSSDMR